MATEEQEEVVYLYMGVKVRIIEDRGTIVKYQNIQTDGYQWALKAELIPIEKKD